MNSIQVKISLIPALQFLFGKKLSNLRFLKEEVARQNFFNRIMILF